MIIFNATKILENISKIEKINKNKEKPIPKKKNRKDLTKKEKLK